jgi:O-antigen/teichoic acid export membrane protein
LITLVTTAFDMSFGPLAFSIWNKEGASRFFSTLQSIYVFFLSAVACVIVILSPFLVDILGGPKYRGAEKVLPYLLFSAIPLSLIAFSSMGIIYAKKPFLSTLTLIIGFITVLILNAIFTPTLLQLGAVNSSVIGHLLIVITGYYFSRRYYKVNFNFKKDGLIFLLMFASSIVMVEVQLADNTIEDILMKMLILIIEVIVVTILFFQSEFQKSFTFLKNLYYSNIRGNARV